MEATAVPSAVVTPSRLFMAAAFDVCLRNDERLTVKPAPDPVPADVGVTADKRQVLRDRCH